MPRAWRPNRHEGADRAGDGNHPASGPNRAGSGRSPSGVSGAACASLSTAGSRSPGPGGPHFHGTASSLRAEVTVHCPRFWTDVAFGGTLGAAESYILGHWSADDLTALCRIFARNLALTDGMERGWAGAASRAARVLHALRRNTRRGALANIAAHYDLGNEFFGLVLDETMSYSCAVFGSPGESLESASLRKVDMACRKLDLGPSDPLLEIGTGWGALAIHAARRYGCRVTTATVSREQFLLARQRVLRGGSRGPRRGHPAGLPGPVGALRQDRVHRDDRGRRPRVSPWVLREVQPPAGEERA